MPNSYTADDFCDQKETTANQLLGTSTRLILDSKFCI